MKLGEFCVVLLVMVMFLQFMGFQTGAEVIATSYGINISSSGELNNADIGNSSSYLFIFGVGAGILILISGAVVVVGFITRSYDPSLVILPLITATATLFAGTFWTMILYVKNLGQPWATALITIIMGGMGVAFIWSCVDYFANR